MQRILEAFSLDFSWSSLSIHSFILLSDYHLVNSYSDLCDRPCWVLVNRGKQNGHVPALGELAS